MAGNTAWDEVQAVCNEMNSNNGILPRCIKQIRAKSKTQVFNQLTAEQQTQFYR